MTPEAWSRVKTILADALDVSPDARSAYLDSACAGDASLRREVESLIVAQAAEWEFFDSPPPMPPAPDEAPVGPPSRHGERVGPYELISELGRGGMGMVYLARRADAQFEKKVAIKLIRPGMASDFALERFLSERQILASLEHPHIAGLLDGGATENGDPYFVLEYVEGEPLMEYCESRDVSVEGRLKLFEEVCDAVQYAHRNLVVHRDIKPGNILVTADGVTKLLDFGIAKLLDPVGAPSPQTGTLFRMMTPDYASPEQIRGARITTASDVYALGVVLYELLTGRKPYSITGVQTDELVRIVCEQDPERPSVAAKSRELAGDLDAIVLKAMRKEPDRRYASVGELAEDLRRRRRGVPVLARRGTLAYRFGKFARRHRAGLAAAAVVLLALGGGVVATLREARRARAAEQRAQQRFDDVRKLANSLLFEFDDAIRDLPGSTPARQLLVQHALQYLDGLASESAGDRRLRRELADAYQKVADVQGNPFHPNLGDLGGGLASYGKAIGMLAPVVASGYATDEEKSSLATAYLGRGGIEVAAGSSAAAVVDSRRGLALREELARAEPANGRRQMDVAQALQFLAFHLQGSAGGAAEAEQALRRQAEILQERKRAEPGSRAVRRAMEQNLYVYGTLLERLDRTQDALSKLREAASVAEALRREEPSSSVYLRDVGYAHSSIGGVEYALGDLEASLASHRRAAAAFEELEAADRKSVDGRLGVSMSHHNAGLMLAELGRSQEALAEYRLARPGYESIVAAAPDNLWVTGMLANLYADLSGYEADGSSSACALLRRSIQLFEKTAGSTADTPRHRSSLEAARRRAARCAEAEAR